MLIYGFNTACKNIAASFLKVGDESMGAIRFRTAEKRELTSLVLYFPQARTNGKRVLYVDLLFYWVIGIHIDTEG